MSFIKVLLASLAVAALAAGGCSSGGGKDRTSEAVPGSQTSVTGAPQPTGTTQTTTAPSPGSPGNSEVSVLLQFSTPNGTGTAQISGNGSPIAVWFANRPGEISLELAQADISDPFTVVEEIIAIWATQSDSDRLPAEIRGRSGETITDTLGTRYLVETNPLPPAPGTETTTTAVGPSKTASPETAPSETTRTPETATTLIEGDEIETPQAPRSLQVRVLNASGVPGAAGALTDRLAGEGYVTLAPENAPRRYSSSAVYFAEGWQEQAAQILAETGIDEIAAPTPVPPQFAEPDATVIVLLGTDTAPAPTAPASALRPRQDNNTQLPLPASTPRDRYVPGLADINIYSQTNDQGTLEVQAKLEELSIYLRYIGNYQPYTGATAANRDTAGTFRETAQLLEDTLLWLGFTPQNTCGAPAGYSFTDLLQPTREWSEEFKVHRGDAIRTTDRLIELHGGERINPSENLDYYIRQAAQTTHDALRLYELLDETEAPQQILCRAWKMPEGEIPEGANAYWYALLTPGIQPRESLLSQGRYHMKYISSNGNRAFVYVCHPTLGAQGIALMWREAGYRAESVGETNRNGCQAAFEQYDNSGIPFQEPTTTFTFGERVFSPSDLQSFPRAGR